MESRTTKLPIPLRAHVPLSVMNSRERVSRAMRHELPDRVPVFCQLALGHYFLHSGLAPHEIWFSSAEFAEALVRLQRRYRFDGILVNLRDARPTCWHASGASTPPGEGPGSPGPTVVDGRPARRQPAPSRGRPAPCRARTSAGWTRTDSRTSMPDRLLVEHLAGPVDRRQVRPACCPACRILSSTLWIACAH